MGEQVDIAGAEPDLSVEGGPLAAIEAGGAPPFSYVFRAPTTRLSVLWWRSMLAIASVVGAIVRFAAVTAPSALVLAGLAGPIALLVADEPKWAIAAAGAFVLVLFLAAQWRTYRRFVVGRFVDHTAADGETDSGTVDLASLLVAELSTLSDLFRVVGGRSGISSSPGPAQVLEATLSVNEGRALEGALASDSTMRIGPVTIPLAPLVTLAGRLSRAARLTGSLHSDGVSLTLTAQLQRRGGLSWQISQPLGRGEGRDGDAALNDAPVGQMLAQLALLVFSDLAIERGVPSGASEAYIEGLRRFRSCLRTPNARKVNLKDAERLFLRALAEDEDLPLGYYNLGVVYTELLGLAIASGRTEEARLHLRAADTSFARAIEKDSTHWQSYFALAQTRLRYRDYDVALDLCAKVDELRAKRADRARAWELAARALRARAVDTARRGKMGSERENTPLVRQAEDDLRHALKAARKAFRLSRRALLRARLIRRLHPQDLSASEPWCAELAAACAYTLAMSYCEQIPELSEAPAPPQFSQWKSHRTRYLRRQVFRLSNFRVGRWWTAKVVRRPQALIGFARAVRAGDADVRCRFGLHLWSRNQPLLAAKEVAAARHGDPTRAAFGAALALVQPRIDHEGRGGWLYSDPATVRTLCKEALGEVAHDYLPARDQDVWELLRRVYRVLERDPGYRSEEAPPSPEHYWVRALPDSPLESECVRRIGRSIAVELGPSQNRGRQPTPEASTTRDAGDSSLSSLALRHLEDYPQLARGLGPYRDAMQRARKNMRDGWEKHSLADKARTTERFTDSTEFQQALREAERATSLNPLSAAAWEMLGDVYRELFDFANARTAWTHALNREPDNPALYEKIGISYWYLAYGDYEQASADDLQQAADLFHSALLLYGNAGFHEQMDTHYRLGKIYVAQGDFTAARSHLGIVESAAPRPPVVGWQLLALAHLSRHEYAECEDLCDKVIEVADHLRANGTDEQGRAFGERSIIGDRVDERLWPLSLIQGWGYLGRALSQVERDANLDKAVHDVKKAREHADALKWAEALEPEEERFPNRLRAACDDCEGLILLKRDDALGAIAKFESSIAERAYSRPYLHLAWAIERKSLLDGLAWFTARQRARGIFQQRTVFERERESLHLRRLIEHATALSPTAAPPPQAASILARVDQSHPTAQPTPPPDGLGGRSADAAAR